MADTSTGEGPDDERSHSPSAAGPGTGSTGGTDPHEGADDRDRTAEDRDEISAAHDQASDQRDDRAEARDRRAEHREQAATAVDPGAASDRAGAWRDRRGGAADRTHAADDRVAASMDRSLSARERAVSSIDALTGAHRRDSGTVELAREVARAQRTQTPLVLAFIDVDGLKATNDTLGHAAGDRLLRRVVHTVRTQIRPYDLIVRYGGDEFLCAMVDCTLETARQRFGLIDADLAVDPPASISAGMTALTAHDTLDGLVARADTVLREKRTRRRDPPG